MSLTETTGLIYRSSGKIRLCQSNGPCSTAGHLCFTPLVSAFRFHPSSVRPFAANFFASIFPTKRTKMNRNTKQLAERLMAEIFLPSKIENPFFARQAGSFNFPDCNLSVFHVSATNFLASFFPTKRTKMKFL
jgi:hypothetical protein